MARLWYDVTFKALTKYIQYSIAVCIYVVSSVHAQLHQHPTSTGLVWSGLVWSAAMSVCRGWRLPIHGDGAGRTSSPLSAFCCRCRFRCRCPRPPQAPLHQICGSSLTSDFFQHGALGGAFVARVGETPCESSIDRSPAGITCHRLAS
jgi:hypothetical protein